MTKCGFRTARIALSSFFVLAALSGSSHAESKSVLESVGLARNDDKASPVGYSSLMNVTRLYIDGRFDALAAGVGFGISWKGKSERFPLEIGAYLAPQFAKATEDGDTSGSVAALVHVTFFKKFGLGIGLDAWSSNGGFKAGGAGFGDRVFFTIGYGLTNETRKSE